MKWLRGPRGSRNDQALRLETETVLPEEQFSQFLDLLREEKAFYSDGRNRMVAFMEFFDTRQAAFEDRRLQSTVRSLLASMVELRNLTALHFLVFPRNQTGDNVRHALHPDYFILEMDNISFEQHDFFLQAEQQLSRAVERCAKAHALYRRALRKRIAPTH